MQKELKKLEQKIMKGAKDCTQCRKTNCIARPIFLYINDVGLDYFCYAYENNKLPEQVKLAWMQCEIEMLLNDLAVLEALCND